jgi:hypothetical protein
VTDTPDRLREIIDSGDIPTLIAKALKAHMDGNDGIFCACDEPVLVEERLMCGRCLMENQAQREARERNMKLAHPFRWSPLDKERHEERVAKHGPKAEQLAMCTYCGNWRDHELHDGQGEEMWGIG